MKTEKLNLIKLNEYGFDTDILNNMIKYEIMFPVEIKTIKGEKSYTVKKDDVKLFLNTILKNTMKLYAATEELEKKQEELKKEIMDAPTLPEYKEVI